MRSFRETGGATVSLHHGNLQGARLFVVSVEGRGMWLPAHQLAARDIQRYIEAQLDLLSHPDYSLGIWYDGEADVTWLDVSETTPDEAEARRRAEERGEAAIYALQDGREIRL